MSPPLSKVLFFGKSKPHTCCTSNLVHALTVTGRRVRWLNPARLIRWLGREQACRRILQVIEGWRPELIMVFYQDLPMDVLDRVAGRIPLVVWSEEFVDPLPESFKERAGRSDLVTISNLNQVDELRSTGAGRVLFSMSGCGPSHYDQPFRPHENGGADIVFMGSPGKEGQRARFLAGLARRFKVELVGRRWERYRSLFPRARFRSLVGPRTFARLCQRSAIVLGMNERNDLPLYFSNRIWLTMACGGFHLTHRVPRIEDLFERGGHLDWFADLEEAEERIEHYLAHPEERRRIAARGRDLVRREHTYERRVEAILTALLGGEAEAAGAAAGQRRGA